MTTTEHEVPSNHPDWGCDDCFYDPAEGIVSHMRTWRVSNVPALELEARSYDDGSPTDYFLNMAELWQDFSADEALLLTSALMEVCQVLDDHNLRKVLNKQVSKRLGAHRAIAAARKVAS